MVETHARPDELSLLAYNAWLLPLPFGGFTGLAKRASELARVLPERDVVVLSEVFQRRAKRTLLEALASVYPHASTVLRDPRPWYRRGKVLFEGGVFVLSRWPIVRSEQRLFTGLSCGSDAWSAKGVSYVCVDKLGARYHILATHAQAPPDGPWWLGHRLLGRDGEALSAVVRKRQFALIAALVSELAIPADEPVIFAGDMNADALSAPDEVTRMLQILDAALPGHEEAAWPVDGIPGPPTWEPARNPLCGGGRAAWLDYVLWSRAHAAPAASRLAVRRLQAPGSWRRHALGRELRDLSDHYALEAFFSFPARAVV